MSHHTLGSSPRWPFVIAFAVVVGCGLRPAGTPPAVPTGSGPPTGVPATPAETLERLARLHAERRATATSGDYVLGPGDVFSVRAFSLDQLNQRVRVQGDGTVTLPLLNTVPVTARTVAQVERDLTERLRTYMYDPSVTVFVEEYRSQEVAVVGAVQHPGRVPMTRRDASVFDALSAAGGTTAEAGSHFYLLPARSHPDGGADGPEPALAEGGLPVAPEEAPIVVDTAQVAQQAQRMLFTLPVRTGDVILVPPRGNIIVAGWVEKPGTYPLQSGLTLRGALAAAGGLSFAAKTNPIRIHRSGANGTSEMRTVDYDAIKRDEASDISLYEGDVVEVKAAPIRLVPYAFYKAFVDIVRVGAGIRVGP